MEWWPGGAQPPPETSPGDERKVCERETGM